MSVHYFYDFDDWKNKCESLGYVFVGCICEKSEKCEAQKKICLQTYALKEGQVVSVFKHFINHGIVFDEPTNSFV
jgi:hypothetical protein